MLSRYNILYICEILQDCTGANIRIANGVKNSDSGVRAAEGPAADVHTRMPLILPKDSEAVWMDSKQTDGQAALDAAQAVAVTVVVHHAVSSRVNNSRSAGADLIEPFPNPA